MESTAAGAATAGSEADAVAPTLPAGAPTTRSRRGGGAPLQELGPSELALEEDGPSEESAQLSEGESGEDDDEGEDVDAEDEEDEADRDPALNTFEADGFLVVDEEDVSDVERQGKVGRRNEERFIPLEEEDLELISGRTTKRLKRLRRKGEEEPVADPTARGDDGDDAQGNNDDDDVEPAQRAAPRAKKSARAKRPAPSSPPSAQPEPAVDEDEYMRLGQEEDEDDFIVDKRGRLDRSHSASSQVTDQQLKEWIAIFGDDRELGAPVAVDAEYDPNADLERVADEDDEDAPAPAQRQQLQELLLAQQQQLQLGRKQQAPKLQELFDPETLNTMFLTKRDMAMRAQDLPERFQLLAQQRAALPASEDLRTEELQREAAWVLKHVFLPRRAVSDAEQFDLTSKIFNVLYFLRHENVEVPYMCLYRKDYVNPLTEAECWDVFDWDLRWNRVRIRQAQLSAHFGDVAAEGAAHERYVRRIESVETEEELQDLADYFQFYFAERAEARRREQHDDADARRQPTARDAWRDAQRQGLVQPASHMAIAASEFGENLWNNQLINKPADDATLPEEFCAAFSTSHFPTPADVLAACRGLLARELAVDPFVRVSIRSLYTEQALFSTDPTEAGIEEIDYWHQFRDVKMLHEVPLKDYLAPQQQYHLEQQSHGYAQVGSVNWDMIALALQAEKAGLVTVRIEIEDPLEDMLELYLSKSFDASAAAWNKERRLVLMEAMARYLHPRMRREVRERLEEGLHEYIARKAAAKLTMQIMHAPFQPPNPTLYEDELPYKGPRGRSVLSLVVPDDPSESPFAAVVNGYGEVLKFAKLSFFEQRRVAANQNARRQELQAEDLNKVVALIRDTRPGAVVVSAFPGSFAARSAYQLLRESVLPEMRELLESTKPRIMPRCMWVDGRSAQVFRATTAARAEFPDYPAPLLQAISAARYVRDPLCELARLWDEKQSIAFVPFHPQQTLVPRKKLLEHLERVFVRATALVGVDINAAWKHPHLAAVLQFVPGLGPRKARHLLQTILSTGRSVERRTKDLRQMLEGSGGSDCVYQNAIAFLRITPEHFSQTASVLDDTRIHPEDYRFAQKIAFDACDVSPEEAPSSTDMEMSKNAFVLQAMKNPHEVVRVDEQALAQFWLESQNEDKRKTFELIKRELQAPWLDSRKPYVELNPMDVFEIVSGESEQTLPIGKIVHGVITAVRKGTVFVALHDGLRGYVRREELTDSQEYFMVEQRVHVGEPVTARVMGHDWDTWEIKLRTRGSDLRDDSYEQVGALLRQNPYLRWEAAEEARLKLIKEKRLRQEKEQLRQQRQRAKTTLRVIDHPSFKNVTLEQAVAELLDAPPGEALFRPSTTKGTNFLTLTYKGLGDCVVNVAVAELDKPNEVALGRKLVIKGASEDFEDLDEVIARYVNPIAALMRTLAQNRHFMMGTDAEIEAALLEEKTKAPNSIPYKVGMDHETPGWFKLHYMPNRTVHHDIISLRPMGFRLRSRTFATLRDLFDWFKRHWSEKEAAKKKPKRK